MNKHNGEMYNQWTEIGLVRHGLTDYIINQSIMSCRGTNQCPLNQEGRTQIENKAITLKNKGWEFICSSDLLRAKETAKIISKFLNIPVYFYSGLREREQGESVQEIGCLFLKRVTKSIKILSENYYGHKFLVISHEETLKAIYNYLLRKRKKYWEPGEKVDIVWKNHIWSLKEKYLN
jgi:broad specificity phosphatase PhoE